MVTVHRAARAASANGDDQRPATRRAEIGPDSGRGPEGIAHAAEWLFDTKHD